MGFNADRVANDQLLHSAAASRDQSAACQRLPLTRATPMATNAVARSTRRVYSAEELHRLRNTQSQPKLSEAIEEHGSEDAELVKGMMIPTASPHRCTDPFLARFS